MIAYRGEAIVKPCKDCQAEGVTTKRKPALDKNGQQVPGGRCVTHHRARKKATRQRARESRWEKIYNLPADLYAKLFAAQGGKCLLCQRATGATRALSVDHDHTTGLVRGLLCRPCNDMLGHMRDSPDMAREVYLYLFANSRGEPFAKQVIGEVYVNPEANERRGRR